MAYYYTQSQEPKVGRNGIKVAPASQDALLQCLITDYEIGKFGLVGLQG